MLDDEVFGLNDRVVRPPLKPWEGWSTADPASRGGDRLQCAGLKELQAGLWCGSVTVSIKGHQHGVCPHVVEPTSTTSSTARWVHHGYCSRVNDTIEELARWKTSHLGPGERVRGVVVE